MKKFSKYFAGLVLVSLVAIGLYGGVSFAQANLNDTEGFNKKYNVIDRTIYRAAETVEIFDAVSGDIYCAGNNIKINGIIEGDVICAGNDVIIAGTVNGDVRVAGATVELSGEVNGNIAIAGGTIAITNLAEIEGDATLIGENVSIVGVIGRDVSIRSNSVSLSGEIGRNAQSYHSTFVFNGDGSIGGNFKFASPNNVYIPNDSVGGEVLEETVDPSTKYSNWLTSSVFLASFLYIAWFISLLIAALGIAFLFPKSLEDSVEYAKTQPLITGFAGLLTIVVTPLALIILAFTIVGIPLGMIIGFLFASALLLATPFTAHLLGSLLLPNRSHPVRALAGAGILLLLFAIPIINVFAIILVTIFGTGLVVRVAAQRYSIAHREYYGKKDSKAKS